MARVYRRPDAEADLIDIWSYVGRDDAAAADRLMDRLEERMAAAAETPGIGSPRPALRDGLRSLAVGSYLIFYEPLHGGIDVIRVLHGARDLSRVAFD